MGAERLNRMKQKVCVMPVIEKITVPRWGNALLAVKLNQFIRKQVVCVKNVIEKSILPH
jgi:hypothetical protein